MLKKLLLAALVLVGLSVNAAAEDKVKKASGAVNRKRGFVNGSRQQTPVAPRIQPQGC